MRWNTAGHRGGHKAAEVDQIQRCRYYIGWRVKVRPPSVLGETMLRRLLAIYMTFVLVAGPCLCCCTTMYAASPPSTTGSVPTSSDRTPPCCCKDHCPAKAEDASGKPQGIDDKSQPDPKPGKHQCPCKD